MNSNTRCWSYLAKFFLEWEMFRARVIEKAKTLLFSVIFFLSKIAPFVRYVKKYCRAAKATDDV